MQQLSSVTFVAKETRPPKRGRYIAAQDDRSQTGLNSRQLGVGLLKNFKRRIVFVPPIVMWLRSNWSQISPPGTGSPLTETSPLSESAFCQGSALTGSRTGARR